MMRDERGDITLEDGEGGVQLIDHVLTPEEKTARNELRFLINLGNSEEEDAKEAIFNKYTMEDVADLCARCNFEERNDE